MARESRRLHSPEEASELMRLNRDDFQWLVDTGQIPVMHVRGHELVDSKDVWAFVDTYKNVSRRRREGYVRES